MIASLLYNLPNGSATTGIVSGFYTGGHGPSAFTQVTDTNPNKGHRFLTLLRAQ
jgi:hypothetical protein